MSNLFSGVAKRLTTLLASAAGAANIGSTGGTVQAVLDAKITTAAANAAFQPVGAYAALAGLATQTFAVADGTATSHAASIAQLTKAMPPSAVVGFHTASAPAGWLKANGAAITVAAFAVLATAIYCGDANNATAISGYRCTDQANPNTTRNTAGAYIVLPDLRGEFQRGFDDGRGVDTGRVLGSFQADAFASHSHTTYSIAGSYSGANGVSTGQLGASNTGNTGGAETRPRNIAVLFCIKY